MLIHSPSELAKIVYSQRKQQKLNQSEVGDKVGLKQTTLSKFETHPDHTQLATLFRILSALDLEIHVNPKQKAKNSSDLKQWNEKW